MHSWKDKNRTTLNLFSCVPKKKKTKLSINVFVVHFHRVAKKNLTNGEKCNKGIVQWYNSFISKCKLGKRKPMNFVYKYYHFYLDHIVYDVAFNIKYLMFVAFSMFKMAQQEGIDIFFFWKVYVNLDFLMIRIENYKIPLWNLEGLTHWILECCKL